MKPLRKVPKRIFLFSSALVLLALVAVSGTLAYMTAKTNMQTNKFDPGIADIEVSEPNGSSYVIDENTSTVNKIVAVTNEKKENAIPVYVRVRLVPILRNANGEGTGEQVAVTYPGINKTKWTAGINGYYYYKEVLKPGHTTPSLITQAKVEGGLPQGRELEIQVIADSIQTVANAEQEAWGMKYNNGSWQKIGK